MRCQLRTLALLLQLLFLIGSGHSKCLWPDEPLWRESIVLDGDETRCGLLGQDFCLAGFAQPADLTRPPQCPRYTLEGLQQGTSYEVKVSWPATVSCRCKSHRSQLCCTVGLGAG